MPQEMWDSLALMPWINRIGTYAALLVLFCMVAGLLILNVQQLDQRMRSRRAETIIAICVLSAFMWIGSWVDKGNNASAEFQSWKWLQNFRLSTVSVHTVIGCWALTAAVIVLALRYGYRRQMQGLRLYGFIAIACLLLSTRAMQLHTLKDYWAIFNLLLAVVCIASIALPVNFVKREWEALTKQAAQQ